MHLNFVTPILTRGTLGGAPSTLNICGYKVCLLQAWLNGTWIQDDHSELMHLQSLILPLVSFNSIDDQALFVGFSMCDFLMFCEMISKFTVEHLKFSYVLIAISPYRPPSRPNATNQRCYIDHGLCARGCGSLISKGDPEELFEDVPWKKRHGIDDSAEDDS